VHCNCCRDHHDPATATASFHRASGAICSGDPLADIPLPSQEAPPPLRRSGRLSCSPPTKGGPTATSQTRPLHPAPGRPAPRVHSNSERIHEHGRSSTRSRPPNARTHLEVQGHLARRLPVAEHHQHVIAQHRVRRRRQKSLKLRLHACLLLNMRRGGAALSTHTQLSSTCECGDYAVRACPRAAEVEPESPCAWPNMCREAA